MLSVERDQIASEFLQGFNNKNMVLYVGTATPDSEVTELAKYPWAGIVTSRRDEAFKGCFAAEEKRIHECESFEDIPPRLFGRDTLNIVRLFGVDRQDISEEDEEIKEARRKANASRIWNYIAAKLEITTNLCMVGYDPADVSEFPRVELIVSLDQIRGGSISFFGITDESHGTRKLRETIEQRGYLWCEESLTELLQDTEPEYSGTEEQEDNGHFWMGGKAVALPERVVMSLHGTASLLTEQLVYKIRPYGRIQQSRWFQMFLSRSAENGPQWYGYLKSSEFYLKREYARPLFALVKNVLQGHESVPAEYKEPIILEGHSGSGKSVTLGALAMSVFEEKRFPVIFITQKELNTDDYDALDGMMLRLREIDADNSKTLIIWDGSTYTNTTKTAKEMAAYLANRGRRFVLVCSAYKSSGEIESGAKWYSLEDGNKFVEKDTDGDIRYSGGCYYVDASRELTERELVDLRNKVSLYCASSAKEIISRWNQLKAEGNNDCFYYFYKMMVILQPPLENNLRIEHERISGYVQKRLDLMQENAEPLEETDSYSPMQKALLEAGIDIAQYDIKEDFVTNYDLERFNTCVALFSRFKIDVPVSLALYILASGKEEINIYGERYKSLFKELTTGMPWILYKENADGEFCFGYRSQLEADIFLRKTCIFSVEDQTNMICEMLDYYYEEYKRFGGVNKSLKNVIQKLLRMIGPNSEYTEFKNPENGEHKQFLEHLDIIIDKIQWLRKECRVPDEDASFAIIEITFVREYYSSKSKGESDGNEESVDARISNYEKYIAAVSEANVLAYKSISELRTVDPLLVPKNMRSNSINSLSVEVANCNYILNEMTEAYTALCRQNDKAFGIDLKQVYSLPYKDLYNLLKRAIYSDPQNGYSYNALFKAFEQEHKKYKALNNKKRCFQLLSEILLIADEACSPGMEIHNRGTRRDELAEHLFNIKSLSAETVVTIDQVENRTWNSEFAALFEEMLSEGNAAGICYVGRGELEPVREMVNENGVIDSAALPTYRKVRDFMRNEKYFETVSRNSQALFLLLQVTWACYAKRELSNGECRVTDISAAEWKEVLEICELYENADKIPRPIITLMHALAVVQMNGDYEEAGRILGGLREDMFFGRRRTIVPYMICENGEPKKYNGKVAYVENNKSVRVRLDNIHRWTENSERGILYPKRSFGTGVSDLERGDAVFGLELGIGYMGFSLYTEEERKKKEARM